MYNILDIVVDVFAAFGAYVASNIVWYNTEKQRYKIKTMIYPKWKAKFKVGDYVKTSHRTDETDILCKVEYVAVRKIKATNEIEISYSLKPTWDFRCKYLGEEYSEPIYVLEEDVKTVF